MHCFHRAISIVCQCGSGPARSPLSGFLQLLSSHLSLFGDSGRCLSHSRNLGCLRCTPSLCFLALTVSMGCPSTSKAIISLIKVQKYHWTIHYPSHHRCLHFTEPNFMLVLPMEPIPSFEALQNQLPVESPAHTAQPFSGVIPPHFIRETPWQVETSMKARELY